MLSVVFGLYIGYALAISFIIFALIAKLGGKTWKEIGLSAWKGAKKSLSVVIVFTLIGVLTATWMASGTVATLVDYLVRIISPSWFLVSAFLITSGISFILGSAFATCSTVGVILMILAQSGGVNLAMTAGVIFSGATFGDRSSPMSAGLNLITNLTKSNHYKNVWSMVKTAIIPFAASLVIFYFFSINNPLMGGSTTIGTDMAQTFTLSPWLLIPAALILILMLCRVPVRYAMIVSIVCAVLLAIFMQGYSFMDMLRYMWSGFSLPSGSPLADIVKGGGLFGQIKNSLVILIACGLSELFQLTGMMKGVTKLLAKPGSRFALFCKSLGLSAVTAAAGCNQTLAIVMTTELVTPEYHKRGISNEEIALDMGLTSIVIPCFVPWNLAALMPIGGLGFAGMGYMPYMWFVYLVPLYGLCRYGVLELLGKNKRKAPVAE